MHRTPSSVSAMRTERGTTPNATWRSALPPTLAGTCLGREWQMQIPCDQLSAGGAGDTEHECRAVSPLPGPGRAEPKVSVLQPPQLDAARQRQGITQQARSRSKTHRSQPLNNLQSQRAEPKRTAQGQPRTAPSRGQHRVSTSVANTGAKTLPLTPGQGTWRSGNVHPGAGEGGEDLEQSSDSLAAELTRPGHCFCTLQRATLLPGTCHCRGAAQAQRPAAGHGWGRVREDLSFPPGDEAKLSVRAHCAALVPGCHPPGPKPSAAYF